MPNCNPHRIVPGTTDYNAPRHVLVKSPFDGLIRRIDVKVGDDVTEGQIMGIVDSPELGERRADVMLRETDLEQAKNEHDWWHAIQRNLDELLAASSRVPPETSPNWKRNSPTNRSAITVSRSTECLFPHARRLDQVAAEVPN